MRQGKARVLSQDERAWLLDWVQGERKFPERDSAILALSFGMGLRAMELAGLDIRDVIRLDGQMRASVVVRKAIQKGSKRRTTGTVDMPIESRLVNDALAAYIPWRRSFTRAGVDPAAPLFVSWRGNRMTANILQMVLAELYARAGYEGCKSHTGRRSFATRLLSEGHDVRTVQSLMRHADPAMTLKYAEALPSKISAALRAVD